MWKQLILLTLLLSGFFASGEGTKDLRPTNTDYGFLNPWDWGGEFATYGASPDKRLYVHVADHTKENIYLGFQAKNSPSYFRVMRPDGTIISGPHLIPSSGTSAGYIASYTEAENGPLTFTPGGYNPVIVDPDVNGDYYIEINQGHPTNPAGPPISSGGYSYYLFDITIGEPSTGIIHEGRLWAYLWALSTGNQFQTYAARMYVLREDSIRFEINYNDVDPFGFGIISNSWGITNTGDFVEDRKSQDRQIPPYQQGNVPYLPEHKIFLNPPDPNIYPYPQVIPSVETPKLDKEIITGCILDGYCVNVEATKAGQAEVQLDIDGTPGFQPGGRDLIVRGRVEPGVNCIPWDGFDGMGDTAYSASIVIDYKFEFGLVHIPIYDAENHYNGYIFSLMTAPGVFDTLKLYYDDSRFNTGVSGANLTGCTVPCRWWNTFYGNERFLNTWSFAYDQSIQLQNIQFSFCPPQINDDTVLVNENTPKVINPLGNDLAPLNQIDRPTMQIICGPFNGSASIIANQRINYTPAAGFLGLDSICYRVCDTASSPTCDTAVVYITVADINLPPNAGTVNGLTPVNDTVYLSTPEDQNMQICIQWSEPEGEKIATPFIFTGPANGSISGLADGDSCFTYAPTPDFNGKDLLAVELCDSLIPPACDTLYIDITVTPVNDPPVITAGDGITPVNDTIKTITTSEDTPKQICFSATDVDLQNLDITQVLISPRRGSVTNVGTGDLCITYTPDINYYGADTVTLALCDDGNPQLCDQVTVLINVLPVNDPPIALHDTLFLDPGVTGYKKIKLNDWDVETPNAILNYTIVANGLKGLASKEGDSIKYIPNASFILGLDSITYSLCDDGVPFKCSQAKLYISIPKSQVPPIAKDDSVAISEDTQVVINILQNDFDPNLDPLNPVIRTQPVNGSAVMLNKQITYTPYTNYNGTDSIVYYVCDNATPQGCDTSVVWINILPVPDNAIVTDSNGNPVNEISRSTLEDNLIQICLTASDGDSGQSIDITQGVSFENLGQISGLSDGDTCFTYTPDPDKNGQDSVLISICDNAVPVGCGQIVVHINILPVNDAVIVLNDTANTSENIPVTTYPLANDSDIKDLSPLDVSALQILTAPAHGGAVINTNGSVDYTPNAFYYGLDSMQYRICDTGTPLPASCGTAWIYINVDPVNDPPIAIDDHVTTGQNIPVVIDVLANDSDPENQPLSVAVISQPVSGTVVLINNQLEYTPDPGFCGQDQLSYTACDNALTPLCDTAVVYIKILPQDNDADSLTNAYETLTANTDGDNAPDYLDIDSDNDGMSDLVEATPRTGDLCDPLAFDFDGDGIPDFRDIDSDNDGLPDWVERSLDNFSPSTVDSDNDGVDDSYDSDYGGYLEDNPFDKDSDNSPDFRDLDTDGDGISDWIEGGDQWAVAVGKDTDGDGIDDAWDPDNGGIGLYSTPVDTDGDGVPDFRDLDSDDDKITDLVERGGNGNNPLDSDGDGIPDFRDTDSDNDGIPDHSDGFGGDCDNDGIPDYRDPDPCKPDIPGGFSPNNDGINDYFVIPGLYPELYPHNSFTVYNRWGNIVYSRSPYDNSWSGESNVKGSTGNRNQLSTGTYFYVFDFGNGRKPITGYVLLKR